jgi:peptide/nickel transport system permease protein
VDNHQLSPIYTRRQLRAQQFALTRRRFKETWQVLRHNRLALVGVILIVLFAIMAVAHPILMSTVWPRGVYSPDNGFDRDLLHPSPPVEGHILGTDAVGRDVLSMLLAGATSAFVVGMTAALSTAVVGTAISAVAAYYRGVVDAVFTHVADALLLLPAPLFMVILGSRFDIQPFEFGLLYGVIAGASSAAIVLRSHALALMSKAYIEASRVAGAGARDIIVHHLVPQLIPLAVTHMLLAVTGAVIADGFLTFMGLLKVRLNWGYMMNLAFDYAALLGQQVQWNQIVPPSVALSTFAAAFYLVARGVHEVVDPRLRRR